MKFEELDIDKTKLPTNRNIIEYFLYLKKTGTATIEKNKNIACYLSAVFIAVTELWKCTNIPLCGRTTIKKMLRNLLKERCDIIKKPHQTKQVKWNTLFRISKCKCKIEVNRRCSCPKYEQIPQTIKEFFLDQCGPRILSLCDIHKQGISDDFVKTESTINAPSLYTAEYVPSLREEEEVIRDGGINVSKFDSQLKISDLSLQNFSLALDRTNTSDRFGSLLATTIIKDLKISIAKKTKHKSDKATEELINYLDGLIIDKNKIQRERLKYRAEAKATSRSDATLKCISYDGKKDTTLKKAKVENQTRLSRVAEEHITILKEPHSEFLGYATPAKGTGVEIQKAIVNYLCEEGYTFDYLVAICCDGTVVNTGFKSGVNTCLEKFIKRPLQWNVCLLHFNELPLKTLITHLYGKQVGPGIWPGTFGSEILACEKYPVASQFEPIAMGIMPDSIEDWNIRSDQRYLLRMVLAVNNGCCDDSLATQKPGPVSTARWLTTASRLLRLYVSQTHPSDNLKNLVAFIVKVYAPFWFLVRSQPQAIHGSRHLFKYLLWIRKLPIPIQHIIQPTIENNSYYFHPENILLAMVTDAEQSIRMRAYEMIRISRSNPPEYVREFRVPKNQINFDCESYTEAINWDNLEITEPPCLHFYSTEELVHYQYSSDNIIEIPEYPCHSQNTERYVRVVNESCNHITDERRLGYIFAKIKSRQQHSKLDSRQDFS